MPGVGEMSIILEKLQQLFVTNSIFVAQCALDSVTPASQVFWHAYRPELEGEVIRPAPLKRPFIVVKYDEFRWEAHSVGCMMPKCTPKIHINDRMRSDDFQESAIEFSNFVGEMMEEFTTTTMQDGGLVVQEITTHIAPTPVARRETNEEHKFWFTEFTLRIGAEFD
jgi:hypothetical protein